MIFSTVIFTSLLLVSCASAAVVPPPGSPCPLLDGVAAVLPSPPSSQPSPAPSPAGNKPSDNGKDGQLSGDKSSNGGKDHPSRDGIPSNPPTDILICDYPSGARCEYDQTGTLLKDQSTSPDCASTVQKDNQ